MRTQEGESSALVRVAVGPTPASSSASGRGSIVVGWREPRERVGMFTFTADKLLIGTAAKRYIVQAEGSSTVSQRYVRVEATTVGRLGCSLACCRRRHGHSRWGSRR